uniref:Uncharacterized protein n=1 Tax=Arundo donax TaxID=35708 RepID=A0A0A9DH09_ARUDO
MVFYRVICPSRKKFCNFCPFVPIHTMGINKHMLLLNSPGLFPYLWIQMVMPPLSALLANAAI